MMKPFKILLFLLSVSAILFLSVLLMPAEGIDVGDINLSMPDVNELLGKDTVSYADITEIIEESENIDSLPDLMTQLTDAEVIDTVRANADSLIASIHRIKFYGNSKDKFYNLFRKFDNEAKKRKVRIMHYGDSQIEGDRITSFIRNKLQKMFGGSGPGLMPAIQPYGGFFSMQQKSSDSWKRYTAFGRVDTNVRHWNYGALAAFTRFSPLRNDSSEYETLDSAGIDFTESKYSYRSVRDFSEMKIFYGNANKETEIEILINDSVVKTDKLMANTSFSVYTYDFGKEIRDVSLKFKSYDSPDIYSISLENKTGVIVDNIPLRGSSGTFFKKLNAKHLSSMYNELNPDMLILQFGGNVMPYLDDVEECERYGRWFKSQVYYLKKLLPGVAVVLIGPSDMSKKDGNKYITYELLPEVVKELKKVCEETEIAYWNMYEAMGGYNSMPSWVMAKPPLARVDYTHFTPRGSKVIANMFYNALIVEYKEFKAGK